MDEALVAEEALVEEPVVEVGPDVVFDFFNETLKIFKNMKSRFF